MGYAADSSECQRPIERLRRVICWASHQSKGGIGAVIANAVERVSFVYVYDERWHVIVTVPSGSGLKGYTQSKVNVRRGAFINSCDEEGRQAGIVPAQ